jgi:serine protease Do
MTQANLAHFSDELARVAGQVQASVVQVRAGRGGIGSGIIWKTGDADASGEAEATVITNAHVVRATNERTFTLGLADGRTVMATVAAVDPEHDLAVLTTRAKGLQAAQIGDSVALRVGELVLAVGNPWGREGAVTVGVVAARAPADPDVPLEPAEPGAPEALPRTEQGERPQQDNGDRRGSRGGFRWSARRIDVIQADIRLYPGNSGGPLTDVQGRVVGVNAMVGGGLGFAIPSRTVQQFLEGLEHGGQRAYLGITAIPAAVQPALRQRLGIQQESGVLVAGVEAGAPAEAAGVLIGDLLLALDGFAIRDVESLARVLSRAGADELRTLTLLRAGERLELALTPVARAA